MNYANALWNTGNLIEAERVVAKLVAVSRRVHGPKHNISMEAQGLLEKFQERQVLVFPYPATMFQALRYENDGKICVLQGPISDPRSNHNEEIHHVENNLVLPRNCPVICHGLVSASHLNGEIGAARGNVKHDGTGFRLAVHFDKKSLKSALVRPANLRIVFELPSEE